MIELRHCSIEWTEYGCITRFADGTEIGAYPHWDDRDYSIIADWLGYGFDLLAYAREHDALHALIAEWLFDKPSPILWGLAHHATQTGRDSCQEEAFVQAMQAYLRSNIRPIVSGIPDMGRWRDQARYLISCEDARFASTNSEE